MDPSCGHAIRSFDQDLGRTSSQPSGGSLLLRSGVIPRANLAGARNYNIHVSADRYLEETDERARADGNGIDLDIGCVVV